MALAGGFGAAKPVDDEIRAVIADAAIAAAIATELGSAPGEITVGEYKTQVVAGVNFKVQLTIGGKAYVAKIHRPLPHTHKPLELLGLEEGGAF